METKNPSKKYIYKTRRAPEPDLKPNGFGFQFSPASVGSGVKFKPPSFFAGWAEPDPLPCLDSLEFGTHRQWLRRPWKRSISLNPPSNLPRSPLKTALPLLTLW
jgi:hypothetical protein